MTIQEAIQNVAIVVANARMTQQEHDALKQSLQMIAQSCKEAIELKSELEKVQKELDELKKV